VKVGDEFDVALNLSTEQTITRLRAQVRFDSTALQLLDAEAGTAIPGSAGSPKARMRPGGSQLDVVASPDDPVRGGGTLMRLHLKALRPRSTRIDAMLNVLGGAGAAVGSSAAPPLEVAIQP